VKFVTLGSQTTHDLFVFGVAKSTPNILERSINRSRGSRMPSDFWS
jgi:hypothetical protein